MMHIPHRKAPLTPSILFNFRAHLYLHDSAHLALWCTLLVDFSPFFAQPISFLTCSTVSPHNWPYLEAASTSTIPAPVSQSSEPKLGKRAKQPLPFQFPSFLDRFSARAPLSSYYWRWSPPLTLFLSSLTLLPRTNSPALRRSQSTTISSI